MQFRILKFHKMEQQIIPDLGSYLYVYDTVKVPTVIVQNSPSHRGNFPIKSGAP